MLIYLVKILFLFTSVSFVNILKFKQSLILSIGEKNLKYPFFWCCRVLVLVSLQAEFHPKSLAVFEKLTFLKVHPPSLWVLQHLQGWLQLCKISFVLCCSIVHEKLSHRTGVWLTRFVSHDSSYLTIRPQLLALNYTFLCS
jgi:hypothetical protein